MNLELGLMLSVVTPDFQNNGFEVELEYTIIGRDDAPVTVEFFSRAYTIMPYTQVANLDFEDIKIALKDYLRAQSDLLIMILKVVR